MSLLVTLPYCQKDVETAKRLIAWMAELGGCQSSAMLLAADAAVPIETVKAVKEQAKAIFAYVDSILVQVPPAHQGWGHATKVMFESVANQVEQCYKLPWLWCEPDCVPVKGDWLDMLDFAYARAPKRFLGARCVPTQGSTHMAGPGVYPHDAYSSLKGSLPSSPHFDLAIANYVLPRMTETPLIQHFWGKPDLAPTFKYGQHAETDAGNLLPLSFIQSATVLFHRNPDGSLIECLRRERSMKTPTDLPLILQTVEDVERANLTTASLLAEKVAINSPDPKFEQAGWKSAEPTPEAVPAAKTMKPKVKV